MTIDVFLATVPVSLEVVEDECLAKLVGRCGLLRGLAMRPDLNEQQCTLLSYVPGTRRFVVNVETEQSPFSIRIANLDIDPAIGDAVFVKSGGQIGRVVLTRDVEGLGSCCMVEVTTGARSSAGCFVRADLELRAPAAEGIELREFSAFRPAERATVLAAKRLGKGNDDVIWLGGMGTHSTAMQMATAQTTELILKDPRAHKIPELEALRVGMPPALPATAKSFDWQPGPLGTDIDLRPESLDMYRTCTRMLPPPTAAEQAQLRRTMLDQTCGLENQPPLLVSDLLGHISLRVRNNSLAFRSLCADDVDRLEKADCLSYSCSPVRQCPVIELTSAREGWRLTATLTTSVDHPPYQIVSVGCDALLGTISEDIAHCKAYDALLACCEAGYLPGVLALHRAARDKAALLKKLKPLATALLGVLPAIGLLRHATAPFDVVTIAVSCGKMFEAERLRTRNPEDQLAAVGAYQIAASAAAAAPLGCLPAGSYVSAFNMLAVALKRAGEFDMAERAYRWGMCHPRPREDLESYRSALSTLLMNAMQLLEQKAWCTPAEINAINKDCTRKQSNTYNVSCAACGKELDGKTAKACARCKCTKYCSKECQVQNWRAHKAGCRLISGSS
mmetsp:Transcript_34052/g.80232  ORF Transcript_34052/g.80232 Transcript_34052/m.80232 type:complete len:619 (-) Transcript_34052:287-2143(-)